ncbi:caspase family protein [Chryseolinea sp. T2]|uniref:caspase family protein n=1 Tax=Chryseolinea sp. T2 TaxID=3129255 RepID=UPI003076CB75
MAKKPTRSSSGTPSRTSKRAPGAAKRTSKSASLRTTTKPSVPTPRSKPSARPAAAKTLPKLYATLIGIDAYPDHELYGCIRDVLDVDLLLRELTAQQQDRNYEPLYMLAPNSTDKQIIKEYQDKKRVDIKSTSPTFDNITSKAFAHLKQAKAGDVCLLYYSGHGSHTQAPEMFWHTKPDRQNETLVCVDSRTAKSRDIIDKEIAYLLWDALDGKKDVHCVVITDCCHSGGITRNVIENNNGIRVRQLQPSRNDIPLEKYIGFKTGYYRVKNKRADIAIARYVHMAACRDNELAQENLNGGLYTRKLVEMLRGGGGSKSYQELSGNLAISVQGKSGRQNPISFARDPEDLNLTFLGGKLKPYISSFEIKRDASISKWVLFAGQMHGISNDTLINISGTETIVKVESAGTVRSILDIKESLQLKSDQSYSGVIASMGGKSMGVGFSSSLPKTKATELRTTYKGNEFAYFKLNDDGKEETDFIIDITSDSEYSLIKRGAGSPVIMPEKDAGKFLGQVNSVGKWLSALALINSQTKYTPNDFEFVVERIEGEGITAENAERLKGKIEPVKPDDDLTLSYATDSNGEDQQPALRFKIAIPAVSKVQQCYVGALFLDFEYGITSQFLTPEGTLLRAGEELSLNYISKSNITYKTIPLSLPAEYRNAGINEASEYLKVIISSVPLNLKPYDQDRLKLYVPKSGSRSIEFQAPKTGDRDESEWAVFTFPIRLLGPNKSRSLSSGTNDFQSFTLNAPDNFSAKSYLITRNDINRKATTANMRGMNEASDRALKSISPPASLWGDDALVEDDAFNNGLGMQSNSLEALELLPANGRPVSLDGKEIVIKPKETLSRTRSLEGSDEFVLPYGYDSKSELYFPLGYSDKDGNIHIQYLPEPTPGTLHDSDSLISTRSLAGSVKLFFKKFINRKKDLNTLALYKVDKDKVWSLVTTDPVEMKSILQKGKGARTVMLIHGITGDTKHMVESMKEMSNLFKDVPYVLTYDYENLATPLEKTSKHLSESLQAAGFGNGKDMPSLTIIAHSMGGLISRRLIQNEGGNAFVKHLILVGVPSGGSEIATLGKSVLGLLTHAMNVTGPIKLAISGLCFLLKKMELNLTGTLEQLQPTSDFIKELTHSKLPAGVKVSIIGGDTTLLKKKYDGDDFFLKRLSEALVKGTVYPGLTQWLYDKELNDMAVTLKSMKDINNYDSSVSTNKVVASNHLAYFREKNCQDELLALIKSVK